MLLLGLTGSIATGKSTVSELLSSPPYSLPIIDADKIARQVVEPGTAGYNAIVSHFASTTPDLLEPPSASGQHAKGRPLNRPALGRRVFGQGKEADRKVLNGIVHPAVRKELYRQMLWAYLRGNWAVVLDIPLLFESGWEAMCGTIMVVAVHDKELQIKRLRDRDSHLTDEDARNRVASQWDVRDKARRAEARGNRRGVVVWNDGNKADLKREIERVMIEVKQGSPQWWAWAMLVNPALMVLAASWNYFLGWRAKKSWEQMKTREKAKL